ncbi:TIR domain-containing protein [Nonomuraea sp. NPDC003201]
MWSSSRNSRERLVEAARLAAYRAKYSVRRKCFLSYHAVDSDEVTKFIDTFGSCFIPRVIGVTENDPLINSSNNDYVMDCIREKYLQDSTVTIVLIGSCTWSRRFVDWEIYSTLRNDIKNRRSGLMGIQLPSVDGASPSIPDRLLDNLKSGNGDGAYARYYRYPTTEASLRNLIEDAFAARTSRASLINNSRARKQRNSSCP